MLAPLVRGRKGEHRDVLEQVRGEGFTRVAVDGETYLLDEVPPLDKKFAHTIEVVVDRLVMRDDLRRRLTDSLETADAAGGRPGAHRGARRGEGRSLDLLRALRLPGARGVAARAGAAHVLVQLPPRRVPHAAPGWGSRLEVDPELVVDPERTLAEGAVLPWTDRTTDYYDLLLDVIAATHSIDLDTRVAGAARAAPRPAAERARRADGSASSWAGARKGGGSWGWFEGVAPAAAAPARDLDVARDARARWSSSCRCGPARPAAGRACARRAWRSRWAAATSTSSACCRCPTRWPSSPSLELTDTQALIGARVIQEINERLRFLDDVGVGYLTLARAAGTLSGGEAQRIRLATQIGSGLVGVLYILDEPSIGLHQRDNRKLIGTLERLRDQGNTVLVVEHDEEMIRSADHVIDMGPGAGQHGGRVVARGDGGGHRGGAGVGDRSVPVGAARRSRSRPSGATARGWLTVEGARRAQPARHRRRLPGRRAHLRHRRVGLRQEHAGQRDRC